MWFSRGTLLFFVALATLCVAARNRGGRQRNRGDAGRSSRRRPPLTPEGLSVREQFLLSYANTSTTTSSPREAAIRGPRRPEPTEPSLQGLVPGSMLSRRNRPDDMQVGCKELRSKRYISDGACTSIKPITEVVCTGHCLPIRNLPWYSEYVKIWAKTKILEYRCVNDRVRRKRVRLLCEDGTHLTYKIKVVKSCKCKMYLPQQNESRPRFANRNSDRRQRESTNLSQT